MSRLIYSNRRPFKHTSRYAVYRTIIDKVNNTSFFESTNPYHCATDSNTVYHVVEPNQEGRLDIISNIYYNTPNFYWVLAWANNLIDPLTVIAGTVLLVPSIDSIYNLGGPLEKIW